MRLAAAAALVAVGITLGLLLGRSIAPAGAAPNDARIADVVAQLKILNGRIGPISVRDDKTVVQLLGAICRAVEGTPDHPAIVC